MRLETSQKTCSVDKAIKAQDFILGQDPPEGQSQSVSWEWSLHGHHKQEKLPSAEAQGQRFGSLLLCRFSWVRIATSDQVMESECGCV